MEIRESVDWADNTGLSGSLQQHGVREPQRKPMTLYRKLLDAIGIRDKVVLTLENRRNILNLLSSMSKAPVFAYFEFCPSTNWIDLISVHLLDVR